MKPIVVVSNICRSCRSTARTAIRSSGCGGCCDHITRNHHCTNLEELLELIFAWLEAEDPFPVEDKVYRWPKAA